MLVENLKTDHLAEKALLLLSGWTDPKDPLFRDAFHAFDKWLNSVKPPITKEHPKYDQAFKAFALMDSAWLRGDLPGFLKAIGDLRRVVEAA